MSKPMITARPTNVPVNHARSARARDGVGAGGSCSGSGT
jgi:hypothetical protein